MSIDIRLKHSSVQDKAPLTTDLVEGELALNINANSPAAYIKDSAGAIRRIDGVTAVQKAGDTMTGDLVFNDGSDDVIGVDVSAGALTASDGTESVAISKAGTVVATGNVQMASLNGGPLAGFRNLLINGDYGIAQRYNDYPWTATGVVANPNASLLFGPDRWGTTQFREFQSRTERPDSSFAGSFQWRTGTQASATWLQVIELLGKAGNGPRLDPLLEADTWTVSHWIFTADRSSFSCNISYVEKGYSPAIESPIASIADGDWAVVDTKGDWTRVAASFSMAGVAAAPAGALGIRVQFVNNGNIRAVGAQLEPGPVATPFEHRPIGTELALCQRYYQIGRGFVRAAAQATRVGALSIFATTMRSAPAVTTVKIVGGAENIIVGDIQNDSFKGEAIPNASGQLLWSFTADAEL